MKAVLCAVVLCGFAMGQVRTETVKQLNAAATAKHLHYTVFCSTISEGTYIGWANVPGHDGMLYIEDGGQPAWYSRESTQQAAAEALLEALKKPPTIMPDHKPKANTEKRHKQCAPPIEGGLKDH